MPGKRTTRGVRFASPFSVGSRNFIHRHIDGVVRIVNTCLCIKTHMRLGVSKDKDTFGARIRQLRERLGLSMLAFAKAVGFDRSYVHRIESGKADNPSLKFIEAVAVKFGIDREWLVGGEHAGRSLEVAIKPSGTLDGYIQMRLEMLLDLIETYDDAGLDAAEQRFSELARKDREFGKLHDQVASIISQMRLRRLLKAKK